MAISREATFTGISPLELVLNAYRKLSRAEVTFFLVCRNLPTSGSTEDLVQRLTSHDQYMYSHHFPETPTGDVPTLEIKQRVSAPDLPTELLADIMDHVMDWELAKAVGVPTAIQRPVEWAHASVTDHAIITGYLPIVRAANPCTYPPTKVGAAVAIRFGYVNILEYFLTKQRETFLSVFVSEDLIPVKASRAGRVSVLSWWKHAFEHHSDLVPPPKPGAIAEAIEGACRTGAVASLDWWADSGIQLEYTEASLEFASAKNRIHVLDWWKHQHRVNGLPLKIGRVMDMASTAGHVRVLDWWASSQLEFKYDKHALHHASCHGKVEVLQWWLGSGLQLFFDQECLTAATRHNRRDSLEWWDKSGLPIQYRMCDIEEALEDAIGGGEAAREFWLRKGVDFNANDKEWMKLQSLN